MATPFVFEILVPEHDLETTREHLQDLTEALRAHVPEVDAVQISARLSVACLSETGDVLDLSLLPFALAERVAAFFGFGHYVLPGRRRQGCSVRAAYARKSR